jgi:hypothetical protein
MKRRRKSGLGPPPSLRGRTMRIPDELRQILGDWMERCDQERAKLGKPPGGPLFPAEPGGDEPWDPDEADAGLARACREIGIPPITLDDLYEFGERMRATGEWPPLEYIDGDDAGQERAR